MMVIKRNHNYRAIDTETKEWVYGSLVGDDYLVTDKLLDNIESDGYIECWLNVVDPNSVCESVHIKDRHKTEMFECDVVAFSLDGKVYDKNHTFLLWYNRECSEMTAISLDGIYFNGFDYGNMKTPTFNYSVFTLMCQDLWGDFKDIKVLGNIIDNPELLGEVDMLC